MYHVPFLQYCERLQQTDIQTVNAAHTDNKYLSVEIFTSRFDQNHSGTDRSLGLGRRVVILKENLPSQHLLSETISSLSYVLEIQINPINCLMTERLHDKVGNGHFICE